MSESKARLEAENRQLRKEADVHFRAATDLLQWAMDTQTLAHKHDITLPSLPEVPRWYYQWASF